VLHRIIVEVKDAEGPRNLATDVAVVDAHLDTSINHDLALREHVRAGHVDDHTSALHEVNDGEQVIVRHLEDWCVLPLRACELAIAHFLHLRRSPAGKGE